MAETIAMIEPSEPGRTGENQGNNSTLLEAIIWVYDNRFTPEFKVFPN